MILVLVLVFCLIPEQSCEAAEEDGQDVFLQMISIVKYPANVRKMKHDVKKKFHRYAFEWSKEMNKTLRFIHKCIVRTGQGQECVRKIFTPAGRLRTYMDEDYEKVDHVFLHTYISLLAGGYSESLVFIFSDSDLDMIETIPEFGHKSYQFLRRMKDEFGTYIVTFDLNPKGSEHHYLKDHSNAYHLYYNHNFTTLEPIFKDAVRGAVNMSKTRGAIIQEEWEDLPSPKPWLLPVYIVSSILVLALFTGGAWLVARKCRKSAAKKEVVKMKSYQELQERQEHQLQPELNQPAVL